jgi:aspartyl-tRNA(Asn)/glutamyl-tRNA(Gln) amidotransferase subunit C
MSASAANTIDRAEVLRIAKLARLILTDAEVDALATDLGSILAYVQKLKELDVSEVLPTSHAIELPTKWRADKPVPGLTHERALANAPEPLAGGFGVPKIIE